MTRRFYRLLLFALPADLRRDFGDDMAQLFADHRREARGLTGVASLCAAAMGDVLQQAAAERTARWRARSRFSWSTFMRGFVSDVRHGLRLLRRYPGMSLVAVTTLALGIGANTAIFSVVDAVMLRALPYPEPDRLVKVWEKRPSENVLTNVVSPADFLDWRRRQAPFEAIAAYASTQVALTGEGEPRRIGTGVVTAEFFDVLRVPALRGRTFQSGEDGLPPHRVAVITHGLWQRQFGADDSIVGRKIILNGNPWEIIGVLPRTFRFPDPSLDIWAPMVLETGTAQPPTRVSHQLDVFGRMKPGVTLEQARDAMDRLGKDIEAENPEANRGHGAWVTSLREEFVGPVSTQLAVLFAAVALVLLIACVNVANIVLARAVSRRREMAVRTALGAGRARLVTQSVVESLALSVVGGLVGLGVGFLLVKALPLVLPAQMSVVSLDSLGLNWRLLAFAFSLAIVTGIVVGLLPALAISGPALARAIAEGGRSPAGVRKRARQILIVSEVALATLALIGGGLVLRSFSRIMSQPLGFDAAGRLTFNVSVPAVGYPTAPERRAVLDRIEQRLAAVPGVKSVGAVNLLPLGGGDSRTGFGFEGREVKPDDAPTRMHPRIVTPGYFAAMNIPIVRGRGFSAADADGAEPVVIVSEASVRRFWPTSDPLNTRVRFNGTEIWRRVVGVAGDVRHWGLTQQTNPMLYWPQAQAQTSSLTFVLETDLDPASLTSAARAQVAAVDAKLPLGSLRPFDEVVADSVRSQRAQTILMGAFGVLGLLLAGIGIYGVMAQLVAVRVPEIGVRMTLGAKPAQVLRQVLGEGFGQTALGVGIGIIAGVWLMKLGAQVLFEVQPWDLPTLITVAAIVIGAALAACLIPARRAMRVDPVNALRAG